MALPLFLAENPSHTRPTVNNLRAISETIPASVEVPEIPFEADPRLLEGKNLHNGLPIPPEARLPWAVRLEHALNDFNAQYKLGQPHAAVNGKLEPSDWSEFHWYLWILGIRDDQLGQVRDWGHLGGWTFTQLVNWIEHPAGYYGTHPGGLKRHFQRLALVRRPSAAGFSHIDHAGLALVESFEGFSSTWYDDGTGTQTIGYGHTGEGGVPTPPISRSQGEALLRRDVVGYENDVKRLVHRQLTQNQGNALTSFDYNLGPGCTVDIAGYINAGQWKAAADHILDYDHANGQVWPGLTRRRQAERSLFLS